MQFFATFNIFFLASLRSIFYLNYKKKKKIILNFFFKGIPNFKNIIFKQLIVIWYFFLNGNFLKKKLQFSGNFWTFKCQFVRRVRRELRPTDSESRTNCEMLGSDRRRQAEAGKGYLSARVEGKKTHKYINQNVLSQF